MRALLAAALLAGLAACSRAPAPPPMALLESYSFDPSTPLFSRVTEVPAAVLEQFRTEDARPDYASYLPVPGELALLEEYFRLLPEAYARVFQARCVGVYFVSNFTGNGLTNWIVGPGGKVYFYIILNPDAFRESLSETLTARERSCFRPAPGWSVSVDAGRKYRGLLYALAHEAAHGLDYAAGVSPYTDDTMPERYRPASTLAGEFFLRTWAAYDKPRPELDFPGRDRIRFYGLGGGPKLDMPEAPALYEGLAAGGFPSLYGARSWAEDLSELETFRTITAVLGRPVRIQVRGPGVAKTFEPTAGKAAERAAAVRAAMERTDDAAL